MAILGRDVVVGIRGRNVKERIGGGDYDAPADKVGLGPPNRVNLGPFLRRGFVVAVHPIDVRGHCFKSLLSKYGIAYLLGKRGALVCACVEALHAPVLKLALKQAESGQVTKTRGGQHTV